MNRAQIGTIIDRIQDFIESDGARLIGSPAQEELIRRARDLAEEARQPGELLYVGILGGTGVGKSTLINALAGREISAASDRRPFTDKAVMYRHEHTEPEMHDIHHLIKSPDAVHTVDAVKDLVLLDLPDFDSVEEENRRIVLELIPRLDCAVWAVSPEKYADAVFYDLVRKAHIGRENFTFVLNKADELTRGDGQGSHERLKEVLGDLAFRLKHEADIDQPRLFSVSALRQVRGDNTDELLEKDFERFHRFLMAGRDAKEVASIKTANLTEKTERLLDDLRELVRPERTSKTLRALRARESDRGEDEPVETTLSPEHLDHLKTAVYRVLAADDSSIGPVRLFLRFIHWQFSISPGGGPQLDLRTAFEESADQVEKGWKSSLQNESARLDSELVLTVPSGSEAPVTEQLDDALVRGKRRAVEGFLETVRLRRRALQSRLGRLRRLWQRVVLALPVAILALKLTGFRRVEQFVQDPNVSDTIALTLTFLTSLFGPEGLIGLLVLLICEVLLIWRLAVRRARKLEREADKIVDRAFESLNTHYQSIARAHQERRDTTLAALEQGIERFNVLQSHFPLTRRTQESS